MILTILNWQYLIIPATATVKCISHYGNPPAILRWLIQIFFFIEVLLSFKHFVRFLGDQEIAPLHPQTNSTEPDQPRVFSATSVVQLPATKERHSKILKCVSYHDYYSSRTVAIEAKLDVRCKFYKSFLKNYF